MIYLSREEIIRVHRKCIEHSYSEESLKKGCTPISIGSIKDANLDFVIFHTENYSETVKDALFWKCAILLKGIAADQIFTDGNKRTAFLVLHTFLNANGYCFKSELDEDEIISFIKDEIADKGVDHPQIKNWIKDNAKKTYININEVI